MTEAEKVMIAEASGPPFYVTVKLNVDDVPKLDEAELAVAVAKMTAATLAGILMRCRLFLQQTLIQAVILPRID